MSTSRSLGDRILVALKQASAEGRLDVAEHLLCALETLEGNKLRPGSPLASAYHTVIGSVKSAKPRQSN